MTVIYYATTIDFGPGALGKLAHYCAQLGMSRPLIVTDTGLSRTDIPTRVQSALSGLPHGVFDGINPNPLEVEVNAGVERYRDLRADGIVAVGGGSAIDGAKAIGLIVSNGGVIADYAARPKPERDIIHALPPIIAVPTIAGSGSEISRGLGVGVGKSGGKANILHPSLFPKVALCDPTLTASVPKELAVISALDALSHCIEAFISPVYNPPIAAIALDGAARLYCNVERLHAGGDDPDVRSEIMMGAIQGGMAMPKGLGPAHGIGIPLDRLHLQHGAIISRLLPKVIRWYGASAETSSKKILSAFGRNESENLADVLEALNIRLGIDGGLRRLGVPDDIVDDISLQAATSPYSNICIRPAGREDYAELLMSAM